MSPRNCNKIQQRRRKDFKVPGEGVPGSHWFPILPAKFRLIKKTLVIRDPMKYKLVQNGASFKGQLCNPTTKRVVEPVSSATRLFP